MPANTALAAMGVTFGACGATRATTSSLTRLIASESSPGDRSIARMHVARRMLAIKAIESFPCLRRKAPEHHVQRLHLVYTEALVSIARIDPQLPIFLRRSTALIGDVVDAREERRGPAAAVTEGYAMRAILGRVHHIEDRAALRPGQAGDGLDHAIAIVDDEANGCALRVRAPARRRDGEQHRCQDNSCRAPGEAIATAPGHGLILLA